MAAPDSMVSPFGILSQYVRLSPSTSIMIILLMSRLSQSDS